jgi:hypothetical protein
VLAGLFVLLAGSASAQSQDMKAMAQQFGQSAKQNAMALRMYAWQMRVEITLKGTQSRPSCSRCVSTPTAWCRRPRLTRHPRRNEPRAQGRIKKRRSPSSRNGLAISLTCARLSRPVTRVAPGVFAKVLTAPPGGFVQLYAEGVIFQDKLEKA